MKHFVQGSKIRSCFGKSRFFAVSMSLTSWMVRERVLMSPQDNEENYPTAREWRGGNPDPRPREVFWLRQEARSLWSCLMANGSLARRASRGFCDTKPLAPCTSAWRAGSLPYQLWCHCFSAQTISTGPFHPWLSVKHGTQKIKGMKPTSCTAGLLKL